MAAAKVWTKLCQILVPDDDDDEPETFEGYLSLNFGIFIWENMDVDEKNYFRDLATNFVQTTGIRQIHPADYAQLANFGPPL